MIKKMLFVLVLILQANVSYSQDILVTDDEIKKGESSVPFAVIEEVPIFPGCEDVLKNERLACFQKKMSEHINNNFKYPREARRKNIQGRVLVMFVINREGIIENIIAKGPEDCEILENEAIRIMSKLPQMTPGKQKGKAVKVKYSQPLTFKLE